MKVTLQGDYAKIEVFSDHILSSIELEEYFNIIDKVDETTRIANEVKRCLNIARIKFNQVLNQIERYPKKKARMMKIKIRKQGYQTKLNKKKVLEELTYHPKYMSKKLLDSDLESMFKEYGY